MLEKKIEKWLVERLKSMGCIADKFVSPGMSGVPDRIVIIPGGRVMFLELKTMAGRVDPLQELQHKRYRRAGAEVRIIKGMDDARAFAMEVETIIRIGAQTW